jgi:hypothetical protein
VTVLGSGPLIAGMNRFEQTYGPLKSPEAIHSVGDGAGASPVVVDTSLRNRKRTGRSANERRHGQPNLADAQPSRGLAIHQVAYNGLIAACDQPRRGDLDGRGNLSEAVLSEFSEFYLNTCLEQIRFRRKVMRLDELSSHIERWVETASAYGVHSRSSNRLQHVMQPIQRS